MAWYPIKGGVVPKVNLDAKTITPGTKNQVIEKGTYLKGPLTILGDADLISSNIKKGVNIFGVMGSFEKFLFGLTKEAHGSFTPSSNSKDYSITHNLGSKPKFIVIYTDASLLGKQYAIRSIQCVNRHSYDSTPTDNSMYCVYCYNSSSYRDIEVYSQLAFTIKTSAYDESTFDFSISSIYSIPAGVTYYWQAMA